MNSVKHNHALEFICSIIKYCRQKNVYANWEKADLNKDPAKDLLDFNPTEEIKDWLSYIDDNISPYFRNDFFFINVDIIGLPDLMFLKTIEENISTPSELIERIAAMDENLLIEKLYSFYDTDLPFSPDENVILEALNNSDNHKSARNFIHIFKNPLEFKNNVVRTLEKYYKKYYQSFEEQIYTIMESITEDHNQMFEDSPVSFVNLVGWGDYSSRLKNTEDISLYVSYFIDYGMFYYNVDSKIIMCYGKTIKDKFDEAKDAESYKTLFKALSDDRRVEILKLTSKRPWYNKELALHFKLTPATLSYHLNLLLDIGVLNFEPSIINNRYYYTTNNHRLKELFDIALKDFS
nr:winged helix-turn-helix domain-containing protein [Tissierella sp.]